jgi:DNA-binding response OmpR family regulator
MARILLIDNNTELRTMLRDTLAAAGHTVIEARDGNEGLALFRQGGADLVITDIVMPEHEGFAVLMELRKAQPPVEVIAMSGGGEQGGGADYLDTARLMGAAKVLLKPFRTATLLAAINELLPGDA